jgi:hypothetical protein
VDFLVKAFEKVAWHCALSGFARQLGWHNSPLRRPVRPLKKDSNKPNLGILATQNTLSGHF